MTSSSSSLRAGGRPSDVVVAVNGQEGSSLPDLYREVWRERVPGAPAKLARYRRPDVVEVLVETRDRADWLLNAPTGGDCGRP